MHTATKYIFVTGGVVSGLGKGVVTASIAKLLQLRGLKVDLIKIDPYLNVDPGTLNPIEHGEVFVCENVWEFEPAKGYKFRIAEVDQDFGTYERFLDKIMHPQNNITSGQVYLTVILKERVGEYLGKTIQVIPHITEEIKRRIRLVASKSKPDVLLIEIGGTVGDIEGMPFYEAIRQFRLEEKKEKTLLVHVTLVPMLEAIGQLKTKPTQHSVKILQSMGLQPDIIIGRAQHRMILSDDIREKISLYSNVPKDAVISDPDLDVIYELPILFERQGLGDYIIRFLNIKNKTVNKKLFINWEEMVKRYKRPRDFVIIGMPGKYTMITDSYISINEALRHAAASLELGVKIKYFNAEEFEEDPGKLDELLKVVDGILLTPGFGSRGVEGMISTAIYSVQNDMPFLGICFGAQLLFIGFMRNFVGLKDANSKEVNYSTPYPVVDLLPEQIRIKIKGGTMRLGAHKVYVVKGTKLYEAYKKDIITERFRHRYHIIKKYALMAKNKGLLISAYDRTREIVNAIEIKNNYWTVGVQFHPEFKSRPNKPSPIYAEFIKKIYLKRKANPSKPKQSTF